MIGKLMCWMGWHKWVNDCPSVRSCEREGCMNSQWFRKNKWKRV